MLNGVIAKATDEGFYSFDKALDDVNQVKVQLRHKYKDQATTKELHDLFPGSKKAHYNKQSSDEFGLECYTENESSRLWCFGKSSYNRVFGYSFKVMGNNTMWVQSWEPIYGGLHLEWLIHLKNLKHWKEVDVAIWRLLESWNVSPLQTIDPTARVGRTRLRYAACNNLS